MESIPTGGEDANAAPVLCQKSGCKVISHRHQVKIYEAEQSEQPPSQNAWVSVVLVAAIAVAIRTFLMKRVRARKAAMKLKTIFTQEDDASDDGNSSGYSSSEGISSRENSVNSFRDLLLASLECSDEDTTTTASSFTDRIGLSLTMSRLLYTSTRRNVNNDSYSEEPGEGNVVECAKTSLYPTLLPASQKVEKDDHKYLLCVKELREDLEKKTTRGRLVNGKREPPGFPPQW